MRPGAPLLFGTGLWLGLAFATAAAGVFGDVALWFGVALGALALIDLVIPGWSRPVRVERRAPGSFALGVPTEVQLELTGAGASAQRLWVFDGAPPTSEVAADELPRQVTVPRQGTLVVPYQLIMRRRGEVQFGDVHLMHRSPLGLWTRHRRLSLAQPARVLPNFAPVVRFSLLAVENRLEQMGIRRRSLRGMGKSFHQLRDYRDGDLLTHIDWKATSRRRKLISREFQEERDQQIVLLLDCSRRMRAIDGETSFFDHALNASLLLTYVALDQGDAVGVMTFSGTDRWLPGLRGPGAMPQVLRYLHDLHPTEAPSDFQEAATRVLTRQKRRALVVVLTNLRDEDDQDLRLAVHAMRRRHQVVVASLREPATEVAMTAPVTALEDAIVAGASAHYLESRSRSIEALRGRGVSALDVRPEDLPVALTNEYLALKDAGLL